MKLVDVMSASGLSMYAIVALLLFVGAFVMVVAMILAPGSGEKMRRAARIPLDDDRPLPPTRTGTDNG